MYKRKLLGKEKDCDCMCDGQKGLFLMANQIQKNLEAEKMSGEILSFYK